MLFQRLGHLRGFSLSFHTINLLNSSSKSLLKGEREWDFKGPWTLMQMLTAAEVNYNH